MKPNFAFLLFFLIFLVRDNGVCNGEYGGLKMYYYEKSCPAAEDIVRNITWSHVAANPVMAAKLLRIHYHDCFVRGCDASILLDSTPTNKGEKDTIPNLFLSGFDIIDEIKAQLEEECYGIVSCADIVALAARDAVAFQFKESKWPVYTGRKDGKISHAADVTPNLPSPFSNFNALLKTFSSKGLDVVDLVALSGAHTIGVGHCFLILKRLYNFTGNSDRDPSLNQGYAEILRTLCPINSPIDPTSSNFTVAMDPRSSLSFDSHYFRILNQNGGLFQSDAALLTNQTSIQVAKRLKNSNKFFDQFARSMVKMGAMGVLTEGNGDGYQNGNGSAYQQENGDGTQNNNGGGEVRRNCRVVNG